MNSTKVENDFLLDPLSVIIKLAILSNKPVGTKICILNNLIHIQEVGPFQSFVRYWLKNNKSDLHYLYNPIEIACDNFLSMDIIDEHPTIIALFNSALKGIDKLKETYKEHSMVILCLNYYANIISNYLGDNFNGDLFKEDNISELYTDDLVEKLNNRWTIEKLVVVLELNNYLSNNINCIETFMKNIDKDTSGMIGHLCNK
jgi:hypothetical protein